MNVFKALLILSNSKMIRTYFPLMLVAIGISLLITFIIIKHKKNKAKGIKSYIGKKILIAGIITSAVVTANLIGIGIIYTLLYPNRVLHIEEPYEVYGD